MDGEFSGKFTGEFSSIRTKNLYSFQGATTRIVRQNSIQLVSSEEHPLKCGYPERLYNPNDFVTCVADELEMLTSNSQIGKRAYRQQQEAKSLKKRNMSTSLCCNPNCNNNNRGDIQIDKEGCTVCGLCGAQGLKSFYLNHGELSSQHDSKAHMVEVEGNDGATLINKPTLQTTVFEVNKSCMKLGYAQELADNCSSEVLLDKRNEKKLRTIVDILDNIFVMTCVEDANLKRQIRTYASKLFFDSFKHKQICKAQTCTKNIADFQALIIAQTIFVAALNRICADGGFTMETIESIKQTYANNETLKIKRNYMQQSACSQVIDVLMKEDNSLSCSTIVFENERSLQSSSKDIAKLENTSFDAKIQKAIQYLSVEYKLSKDVRLHAINSVQDTSFLQYLMDLKIKYHKDKKIECCAYIILCSVSLDLFSAERCTRFGLDYTKNYNTIKLVRSHLPLMNCNVNDVDDNLY
jgi:ferredoxin-like protein FixX